MRGVRVGLVARINDWTVEGRLEADLVFDEVCALRHLKTGYFALLSASHASRTADNRTSHHEGREATNDRVEVGDARHLVVLVGAVGGTLTVSVVLDEDDRFLTLLLQACHHALRDHFARAIPQQSIACTDRLGSGVLGVSMVDVQARTVRQDGGSSSRKRQLLSSGTSNALRASRWCEVVRVVSEKRGINGRTRHTHAAQIVEGILTRIVPPHNTCALGGSARAADLTVGRHDLRRQSNRICPRVAGTVDAILGFGTDNAFAAHFTVPIGFTFTISGARPLVRAQSSGDDVAASSNDSFISSWTPRSRCSMLSPEGAPINASLIAYFFARSTIPAMRAPETRSER